MLVQPWNKKISDSHSSMVYLWEGACEMGYVGRVEGVETDGYNQPEGLERAGKEREGLAVVGQERQKWSVAAGSGL